MHANTTLFSPIRLDPCTLPNRMAMAPMTRNRAGEGNVPQPINAEYYAQRASAGLIITEATQISPQGVGYPATPGIHSAEQVAGWKLVTDAVHAKGGHLFATVARRAHFASLVAAQWCNTGRTFCHQAIRPGIHLSGHAGL